MAINISTESLFKKLEEFNSNPNHNNIINEKEIEDDNDENILNLFNKVYMLSAEAKTQGVKEYIHYLLDNKCKFLVFAHHKLMLDAIEEEVIKMKIDYIRIDGKVKLEKRQESVNKFQTDETCLVAILSITACYTGITLTAASTVVFSELHMTPAVMIQAEDRAHRIGQEHECVNIHYLYGPDTLDEVLFKMLNQKQNIFSNTLDNMSKNMEVRYTFKKVGDFEKGRSDLEVGINNKKIIVTNSGIKNRTLNDFVSFNKKNETNDESFNNNNEMGINLKDVNLHKSQVRLNREYTHNIKTDDDIENDNKINSEDINISIDEKEKDKNLTFKNILEKSNSESDNDSINKPTKDKKVKNKKGKKTNNKNSDRNNGKVMFKSISDFFK